MSDGAESPFDDPGGREYGRVLVVLCCVLAIVVAALLVPLISSGGLAGTPAAAAVPIPGFAEGGAEGSGGSGTGGESGGSGPGATTGSLGALNPGQRTGVGGSLAGENATNPFQRLGAETHFVVRTTEPTYWRTGAYDRYIGSGWENTRPDRPYDPPIDPPGLPGREVRYEVRLARSAGVLPTAWRPRSVDPRTEGIDLLVTGASAVRPSDQVPAGTAYAATSTVPERGVPVLRSTGRDYPDAIETRYTQLPAGTRDRLEPFVADLTADADSPYETAATVESWLETNKEYSLNVSEPPRDDVATQFVFDLEAGYCEYFATAMVAMLRSQGVPARYVVGYSTGEPTGPNEYTVRGMNAHAWVEVYFADVGWVRFDPTPGSARLATESAALRNRTGRTLETAEEGSPGETARSPAASNATQGGVGTPTERSTGTPADTEPVGQPTSTPGTGTPTRTGTASGSGTASGTGTPTGDSSEDGSGELGALDPGEQMGVGGTIADENATNPFQRLGGETHFVVESDEPAYWRTGAYDRYTGSGWEETLRSRPYAEPIGVSGPAGSTFEYRVRLNRSSGTLPTAWRPRSVTPPVDTELRLTGTNAVETQGRVPAGTTYEGVSTAPSPDAAELRSTGRDYPNAIETRYTQLPAGTRDRLEPFVADLTADADSPYETAATVESWLETNKEYSLEVDQPPGDDVAAQFVFDLEAGYCEYFATAMVAMLRSQGVPARYVVGYSTGEQVAPGRYRVRGMHAHAWVEVYFADVGWVRFDPTPGSARLDAETAALEEVTDESPEGTSEPGGTPTPDPDDTRTSEPDGTSTPDPDEPPSAPTPTPTPTPVAPSEPTPTAAPTPTPSATATPTPSATSTPTPTPSATPTPTPTPRPPIEVSLNRSVVPGATVNVSVTRGGSPVVGAGVLFNGERVGTTDATGSVVAEIPYVRRLNVTVVPPPSGTTAADLATRFYAVGSFQDDDGNATVSFEVPSNVSVSVSGDRVTAATVVVSAAVEDVPVRDATVLLAGERVARTDGAGRAEVRLPTEPGNVTLAVRRGELAGSLTLSLARLSMTVDPMLPLALPFTRVEVTARLGNETVSGTTVAVEGRRVGTTGVDGTLAPRLPLVSAADVSVSKHGQRRRVVVDGLYRNLAGVAVALALLVGGVAFATRRSTRDPRTAVSRAVALLVRYVRLAVDAVVRLGELLHAGLSRLLALPPRAADHLRALVAGRIGLVELIGLFLAWLRALLAGTYGLLQHATEGVSFDRGAGGRSREPADPTTGPVEDHEERLTLREVWEAFLEHVSVGHRRTLAPGEVAHHAVHVDGLPEGPVETIRDAYREVEYGRRAAGERLPRAESALRDIEAAATEDTGDPSGPEPSDDGATPGGGP